ncbi:MAG: hypothetical protein ACYDAG_16140 [Chloroflexota bacterium]
MNKAVVGTFPDSGAAGRAINDLKAQGFGGENISHFLRETAPRGTLAGPRIFAPGEILRGLVTGVIVGGILGIVADLALGITAVWALLPLGVLPSTIVIYAVVGGAAGLIEGVLAAGTLSRASQALSQRDHPDATVAVHTDEAHSGRAMDILRAAGAIDVRRGASSIPDEFRTMENVQPESYGQAPVVAREREYVEMPPHVVSREAAVEDSGAS